MIETHLVLLLSSYLVTTTSNDATCARDYGDLAKCRSFRICVDVSYLHSEGPMLHEPKSEKSDF